MSFLPNVTLTNEHTSVVDGLGQAALEDLSLETTLQEVLDLQGQHVIETHAGLIEHTDADETTNKGVTLEKTLGVLVIELQELTGRTTDLGEDETNAPNLALVAETVLAGNLGRARPFEYVPMRFSRILMNAHLQLGIETSRLERTTGDLVTVKLSSKRYGARL